MTGPDAIALAQHQQARQFNVAGADLLEEIYAHLCAVRVDLLADRIDAEHITSARDLALIAWRAQRALATRPAQHTFGPPTIAERSTELVAVGDHDPERTA